MTSQPNFYIVRPGTIPHWSPTGEVVHEPNIVPLIPADLLPDCIDLNGVARHLSFKQTAGMTNLGDMAPAGKQYGVRFVLTQGEESDGVVQAPNGIATPESSLDRSEMGHDKGGECPQSDKLGLLDKTEETRRDLDSVSRKGLASSRHNVNNKLPAVGPAPSTAREPDVPEPSTPQPENDRKRPHRYCRHWVRKGWCPYDASCHFKHAMPKTAGGLRSVGLQEIPHHEMRAGLKKSGLHSAEVEEGSKDVESMMSSDVARGRTRRDDHGAGGVGKIANKTAFKGKGKSKCQINDDLIDLL